MGPDYVERSMVCLTKAAKAGASLRSGTRVPSRHANDDALIFPRSLLQIRGQPVVIGDEPDDARTRRRLLRGENVLQRECTNG